MFFFPSIAGCDHKRQRCHCRKDILVETPNHFLQASFSGGGHTPGGEQPPIDDDDPGPGGGGHNPGGEQPPIEGAKFWEIDEQDFV